LTRESASSQPNGEWLTAIHRFVFPGWNREHVFPARSAGSNGDRLLAENDTARTISAEIPKKPISQRRLSMDLKAQITEDMKAAMRARETQRLAAIRLVLAAIKQKEVDERKDLTDQDVVSVIEKMIKQRRESISQYEKAARADLADVEKFELAVLQGYMPQALSESDVEAAVAAALTESGAQGVRDMGKVMGVLKSKLAGRADMSVVSAMVKARLSG